MSDQNKDPYAQYWADRSAHVLRMLKKEKERPQIRRRIPKNFAQNHTRSTFNFKQTGRMVPLDLTCHPDQVPMNPGWERPLVTIEPNFSVKREYEWWVCIKTPTKYVAIKKGFKVCCKEGKWCERDTCAKCWAHKYVPARKDQEIIILETMTGKTPQISDPAGVDPQGKRPQGQEWGEDQRWSAWNNHTSKEMLRDINPPPEKIETGD